MPCPRERTEALFNFTDEQLQTVRAPAVLAASSHKEPSELARAPGGTSRGCHNLLRRWACGGREKPGAFCQCSKDQGVPRLHVRAASVVCIKCEQSRGSARR